MHERCDLFRMFVRIMLRASPPVHLRHLTAPYNTLRHLTTPYDTPNTCSRCPRRTQDAPTRAACSQMVNITQMTVEDTLNTYVCHVLYFVFRMLTHECTDVKSCYSRTTEGRPCSQSKPYIHQNSDKQYFEVITCFINLHILLLHSGEGPFTTPILPAHVCDCSA